MMANNNATSSTPVYDVLPMVPPTSSVEMTRNDSQDIFKGLSQVMVKQKFEMQELCGIEAKNRYLISAPEHGTQNIPGPTMLFAQEQSDGCERICCALCRSLTMNIHVGTSKEGPIGFSIDKPWNCPMLPCPFFLHPILFATWLPAAKCDPAPANTVTQDGMTLGSVTEDEAATCACQGRSTIHDESGKQVFETGPTNLANTLCCPICFDDEVPVTRDGQQVAMITRPVLSCAECCGKMNRFRVDFGQVVDPKERKLLFAAAMMFDLMYWEVK